VPRTPFVVYKFKDEESCCVYKLDGVLHDDDWDFYSVTLSFRQTTGNKRMGLNSPKFEEFGFKVFDQQP
jgi:hypothetical protein